MLTSGKSAEPGYLPVQVIEKADVAATASHAPSEYAAEMSASGMFADRQHSAQKADRQVVAAASPGRSGIGG